MIGVGLLPVRARRRARLARGGELAQPRAPGARIEDMAAVAAPIARRAA